MFSYLFGSVLLRELRPPLQTGIDLLELLDKHRIAHNLSLGLLVLLGQNDQQYAHIHKNHRIAHIVRLQQTDQNVHRIRLGHDYVRLRGRILGQVHKHVQTQLDQVDVRHAAVTIQNERVQGGHGALTRKEQAALGRELRHFDQIGEGEHDLLNRMARVSENEQGVADSRAQSVGFCTRRTSAHVNTAQAVADRVQRRPGLFTLRMAAPQGLNLDRCRAQAA